MAASCFEAAAIGSDAPLPNNAQPDAAQSDAAQVDGARAPDDPVKATAAAFIDQGRHTFRFDTFGDEDFWGRALKLHQAIEGAAHDGGVGAGVSPATALSVGLKVDVDALPATVVAALQNSQLDLNSPESTLAFFNSMQSSA